jgi:hypothetical protein
MRALIDNEPPHGLGLDRREVNALVAKLLKQKTTDDEELETARRRRKTACVVHVRIETTQFLIHQRHFQHPLRDHRMDSQDDQQMPKCGSKILARVNDRSRTPATR